MSTKKSALIIGASSGLGKEVAELLFEKGYQVFASSSRIEKSQLSQGITKIPCDVTSSVQVEFLFESVMTQCEHLDVVVFCVGKAHVSAFDETTPTDISHIITTNLTSALYVARGAYALIKKQKAGHIMLVGSTSSLKGRADEVLYCASKWGLRGLAQSLALEAKPSGVKVTGVYPGGMNTPFWTHYPEKLKPHFLHPKDVALQIVNVLDQDASMTVSEVVIETMN